MDPVFDMILQALMRKGLDTNSFIASQADKASIRFVNLLI
jgi:hypothetical protein